MLSRISRARLKAAPARLRRLRAYSSPSNASEGASPVEPGALDVDDAHLLPPDSTVLGSLDEHNPIGEIARALHLPIGDEPHLAEAGFEPPQVIQQAAPEPTTADNPALPATPANPPAESEVFSAAGPASSGSGRKIPSDRALGLEREPTHAEYDKRRVVVEVHNGVRHMANAFAVIRYLERTYGRVSHFNLTRSADVEEDYRGSMFVTFKHPASTHRIIQAGILNVQIPEPTRSIPFRPGSVGLDELQAVLMRVPEEFGDAGQQALFDAEAGRQTAETEFASAATSEPQESAAKKSTHSDASAHPSPPLEAPIRDLGTSQGSAASSSSGSTGTNAAVHARALESNLPKLFLKIQPYKTGLEATEAARFGDVPGDFVRTRPMPGQQFAIGGGFALFSGFAPETSSSARMQAVLHKWRPFMPVRPSQPSPSPEQLRSAQETAPAAEVAPEHALPEQQEQQLQPISLDALPKPKWQARAAQKRERERQQPAQPQPQPATTDRVRAERKPERRQREPASSAAVKTSAQRPKGAAALEEARRVAQAANERAAAQVAAASEPTEAGAAASESGHAKAEAAEREHVVHEQPVSVESKESVWRKLSSRLGSFIGGSGDSSSNRQ